MNKMVLSEPSYISELLDHTLLSVQEERTLLIEKCRLQDQLDNNADGYTDAGRLKLENKLNEVINGLCGGEIKVTLVVIGLWQIANNLGGHTIDK